MKSYGIEFEKGTSIENANIEYAAKFPEKGSETSGQLFFRTDENKLYIRNGNNTAWLSLTPAAVTEQTTKPGDPPHGFTDRDIGTPIYFGTDSRWHKAIADSMKTVPTAVVSHVVDKTHFITQQSGTINGISPNVNADGGPLIPGEYYYVSNTVAGKYTKQVPAKDQIKSLSILAVAPDVALLLNYAPQKALFLKDIADFDVPPTAKPTNGQIIKYNEHSASGNGGWEFADEVQVSVGTIHLPGGTAASPTGISNAWKALGTTQPTDPMVIANYAGSAYIKLGDGNDDHHWTLLGSATAWATPQEVIDGTETAKGVTPATLKGALGTYLPLTGGTLTGTLELSADPVNPMEAVTKQYVNDVEKYISDELNTYVNDLNQDIGKIFDQGINALIDTPPTDGQTLVYDTTTDPANPKWKPGAVSTGGTGGSVTLSGLTDVDLTRTPTAGQTLVYDTTDPANPTWKPGKAGVDTLAALTDTNFSTQINDGELLRRESGAWKSDMLFIKPVTFTNTPGQIGIGNAWKSFGLAPPGGKFTFILANYNNGIYIKSPDKTGANDADWDHLGDYLSASGGTLTGPLTLAADPANPMESVTRQYLEAVEKSISDELNTYVNDFNQDFDKLYDPTKGVVLKTDGLGVLDHVDTTGAANGQALVFDGTDWKPGAGVSWAAQNDVDSGTGAATGVTPVTLKSTLQSNYVPLTGGTLTGDLIVPATKIASTGVTATPDNAAATKKYVDDKKLDDFAEVDFTTTPPADGLALVFNGPNLATGKWEPKNISPTIGHPNLATAANIESAWIALGTKPTEDIIIASYDGKAYINIGDATKAAGWVEVGMATDFANATEMNSGNDTTKAINVKIAGDWVKANYVPLGGGTMTGELVLPAMTTGSNALSAVTKTYVDTQLGKIENLGDVDLSIAATDGQTLVFENSSKTWKPGKAGVDTLAALTDTNIGTPGDGLSLVYDGPNSKWVPKNISPTVGNITMVRSGGGTGIAGIGAAWTAAASKPTDPIIIANYDGAAYVKTGVGGADGDWVSLGSSTAYLPLTGGTLTGTLTLAADPTNPMESVTKQYLEDVKIGELDDVDLSTAATNGQTLVFDNVSKTWKPGAGVAWATQPEVTTGTEAAKGITPATLTGHTVVAGPAAAGNSGKLVGLDSNGKIAAALLPTLGTTLQGAHDFTIGAPTSPASGNIWFNNKTGNTAVTIKTVASPGGNEAITSGDMVLYDGTNYHIIPREEDLSDFVSKTRNNSIGAGMTMTWAASTSKTTVLDGSDNTKSQIANFDLTSCTLDGGTF